MRVSRKGITFLAAWEGFRSCPYRHSGDVWTIGYGTTSGSGRFVGANTPCISKRQARKWLRTDLATRYVPEIPRQGKLRRRELDALASFAYNLGTRAVGDPEYSGLARRLRSKEGRTYEGRKRIYREELPRWVSPGTQFEAGLTRRRMAEVRVACRGDYSGRP